MHKSPLRLPQVHEGNDSQIKLSHVPTTVTSCSHVDSANRKAIKKQDPQVNESTNPRALVPHVQKSMALKILTSSRPWLNPATLRKASSHKCVDLVLDFAFSQMKTNGYRSGPTNPHTYAHPWVNINKSTSHPIRGPPVLCVGCWHCAMGPRV